MIEAGTLAYFDYPDDPSRYYRPLGRAHNFRSEPKERVALLWGDPVYVISVDRDAGDGGTARVSAKGHHLELPLNHLREDAILCLYQIDCGQGDATLVHLPDDRWMMVDGGPNHHWSNSGKIAPDFLYWKMFVDQCWKNEFDFRRGPFHLDALVCSHPDYDHYGGFLNMTGKLRQSTLTYGTVFHNGMGRFSGPETAYEDGRGLSQLGPVEGDELPEAWLTTLIDGFDDVQRYLEPAADRPWVLAGSYRDWLADLLAMRDGEVGELARIDHSMGHLPGFAGGGDGEVSVRVLGPVVEDGAGKPGLRYLDRHWKSSMEGPSKTRNGHSVVLRLDYGRARLLLTGDLNFRSQALLLEHLDPEEFSCHVAKACHHGSEDVSATFLEAMSPHATMISSGDNESYAHPRAKVLGMCGAFAKRRSGRTLSFLGLEEPEYLAPLVYSTELSRSIQLFEPHAAFGRDGSELSGVELQARKRSARRGGGQRAAMEDWLLGDRMVYGLINVRTDGDRIVLAVLKEDDSNFQCEEIEL